MPVPAIQQRENQRLDQSANPTRTYTVQVASEDTRWLIRQWVLSGLATAAPFVATALDADPTPFAAIFFVGAALVLVFGVWRKPPERRAGLLATVLLLGCLFWAGMAKPFLSARLVSDQTACLSNLKRLAQGTLMYATDYDDRLPLATSWYDAIKPYKTFGNLRCKEAASPWSYALNLAASGASLEAVKSPELQVMLFEGDAALPNASGGSEWVVYRHYGTTNVAQTDGSVKRCNPHVMASLEW